MAKKREKKYIISFDIDFTLVEYEDLNFSSQPRITPSALRAIELLREDNIIVLATGRDLSIDNNRVYIEPVHPHALVHANGARVSVGGRELHKAAIPKGVLHDLFSIASAQNISLGIHLDRGGETLSYFVAGSREYKEKSTKALTMELLNRHDIFTLYMVEDDVEIDDFQHQFPALSFYKFGGIPACDIVMKDVSKRNGMQYLLDYYGKTFQDVIAFGDSDNDIELIKAAKYGVAMGNANQAVKDAAYYVTDNQQDDGIWNACRYLNLI